MRHRALAAVIGPLLCTGVAPAGFVGVTTTARTNPFGLRVVNVYAVFDRPGEDHFNAVASDPPFVLDVTVVGGTFYQHQLGSDRPPDPQLFASFPELRYDTFVTIGVMSFNSNDPGNPEGEPEDHMLFTPTWPGFGVSQLILSNDAWLVVPSAAQGDPFDPAFFGGGNGQVLVGQFTTDDGSAIQGTIQLNFISNGVTTTVETGFSHVFPGCDTDPHCDDKDPCNGIETCVDGGCVLTLPPDPDCNGNMVLDACDIADLASLDCNGNGVPDECDLLDLTSFDCNGNGIPDECDIADLTSGDCNGNGIPDECDIADMTSDDCNGNGVPDACDIADLTSSDCNGNTIPDECDIDDLTSPDFDDNGVPDECEQIVYNATTDTYHGSIIAAIAAAGDGHSLLATPLSFELEPVIDFAGKAVDLGTLFDDLVQPDGGLYTLADGSGLTAAAGHDVTFGGHVDVGFDVSVELAGEQVAIGPTGSMSVDPAAAVAIATSQGLAAGGDLTLLGAAMGAEGGLANTGTFTVYGDLAADVLNDGDVACVADTQVVGDYVNNGTTTVQGGTLTILGALTNNGTIVGNVGGAAPYGVGDGLTVLGDLVAGPDATLSLPSPGLVLRIAGDYDIAIDDHLRHDMGVAELRTVGLAGATQDLEMLAEDIGPDPAGRFPIGTLRVGPSATTVNLVDHHDNDGHGQASCEAVYVQLLIVDADATLNTGGCRVYYAAAQVDGIVDDPASLVEMDEASCPWDCDGSADGRVDTIDFLTAIGQWDQVDASCDFDGGGVGTSDFLEIIARWGVCP